MKIDTLRSLYQAIGEGSWVGDLPLPGFDGIRLHVRGMQSREYQKRYFELATAVPADQRGADGELSADARRVIVAACVKDALLLGWEGIDDPYTPENVDRILADEVLGPSFVDAVLWCAGQVATTAEAALEQDAKNSATPSAGS